MGAARDLFFACEPEILLEGPAGTGKTRAVLERINYLCEAYPKVRALICRETRTSCTESILVTLERDVLRTDMPGMQRGISRAQRDTYDYENKSVIVVGGLDHPERLYSTEWDLVYVAESTEITEDAWERFARAMRNKAIPKGVSGGPQREGEERAHDPDPRTGELKPAFWTQRIADCNPQAPGHWLNQRAIAGRMRRLKSRHEDNPSVTEDFLAGLRALTGNRRARLYEGLWVSAEGSVFPSFQESKHVCDPFEVPRSWPFTIGYDAGFDHPCAVLWFATAPNGCIYIADEIYGGGITVEELNARIHEKNQGRDVRRYYGDPRHVFRKTQESPKSIADQMRTGKYPMTFHPWKMMQGTDVDAAVESVRKRLDGGTLKVFRSCRNTINEFQSWQFKRTVSGELPPGDDKYEDKDNHAMDVVKGVLSMTLDYQPGAIEIIGRPKKIIKL